MVSMLSRVRANKYRTIVADPPWPYPEGFGVGLGTNKGQRRPLPYPSMAITEIAALPVLELAEDDAHLYLWTTNRYLRQAFGIIEDWGFRHSQTLVWAKVPRASFGAYGSNVEFVLFARRGSLAHLRKTQTSWFDWKRVPTGAHSRKPEAFLDIVESVSPGPYLELFARRNRLGWDTWGNEALEMVEL